MTLQNGLQEMVAAIQNALRGEIVTGCGVIDLQPQADGYTLTSGRWPDS